MARVEILLTEAKRRGPNADPCETEELIAERWIFSLRFARVKVFRGEDRECSGEGRGFLSIEPTPHIRGFGISTQT
jgi:hypothetical protein